MAIRGQQSEPLELHPGASVREAARIAELETWAWGRARALRIFYSHLAAYVVINFVLFLIDSTSPGPAWFYAPLVGWGAWASYHLLGWQPLALHLSPLVSFLLSALVIRAWARRIVPDHWRHYFWATLLAIIAVFIASYVPARRAAELPPVVTLRGSSV